jgi:hypothetical protein
MRFDSENGKPLQVSWNRKIRDSLDVFIPKSMGFGQPLLGVLESTGILRDCRKSPKMAILAISHAIKSITYRR